MALRFDDQSHLIRSSKVDILSKLVQLFILYGFDLVVTITKEN